MEMSWMIIHLITDVINKSAYNLEYIIINCHFSWIARLKLKKNCIIDKMIVIQ